MHEIFLRQLNAYPWENFQCFNFISGSFSEIYINRNFSRNRNFFFVKKFLFMYISEDDSETAYHVRCHSCLYSAVSSLKLLNLSASILKGHGGGISHFWLRGRYLSLVHKSKFSLTSFPLKSLTCSRVRQKLKCFPWQVAFLRSWYDQLLSKAPCRRKILKENLVVCTEL